MVNRKAAHEVLVERRVLLAVTGFLTLGCLLWIIAMSTNYWGIVDGGTGVYIVSSKHYFLRSYTGIWKTCRTAYENSSKDVLTDLCTSHRIFTRTKLPHDSFVDYQKTVASFSIISLVVMVMGIVFSGYTFLHTRYMYKRLAACIHLVTAGCVLIVIEVATTMFHYAACNMPDRHPPKTNWHYGYSFMLAWVSFIAEATATLAFGVCSRKRKKDKAPDDEYAIDEEPTIIGR